MVPLLICAIVADVFPSRTLGTILGIGSFAGTMSSVVLSSVLPGYSIPLLGYTPLLLTLSFVYLAASVVIGRQFKDFQPMAMPASSVG